MINGEAVDALARVTHRDKATAVGRRLCAKLRVGVGDSAGLAGLV
jgi:translation elongation factor EF-4